MTGRRIGLFTSVLLMAAGLLSSCATREAGDYRVVASPQPKHAGTAPAVAGLSPLTASRDSENLFFCPSPAGTWGIFSSDRHSANLRLYRVELKRSGLLYELPGANEGNNIFPALNGDASKMSFSSDRTGSWRVYVLERKNNAVPQAVSPDGEDALCATWDPRAAAGEERLTYCRFNHREEQWEVCLLELVTGQIAHLGPGLFPAWSPDGNYLAVQRPRGRDAAQFGLWLVRVDGSEPNRELVMGETWAAANPCWSPDGRYLAFNTVGRGKGESLQTDGGGIYLVPVHGPSRLLGPLPGAEHLSWRPSWARDGRIYFHRREGAAVNVYAIPGPELKLKTDLADGLKAPAE